MGGWSGVYDAAAAGFLKASARVALFNLFLFFKELDSPVEFLVMLNIMVKCCKSS